MGSFLTAFTIIMFIIVLSGVINHKLLKMNDDIALVIITFALSAAVRILMETGVLSAENEIISYIKSFKFEEFLFDGILCFILFGGAGKAHINKLFGNMRTIGILSVATLVLSALIYGALFFLLCIVTGTEADISQCILVGCIISPTDPFAVTKQLDKAGMSKGILTVIEGESLFNDGTGFILFVIMANIASKGEQLNVASLILHNLFGAVFIGVSIAYILTRVVRIVNEPIFHIFISLLAVTSGYVICEHIECSGHISVVIIGMIFSHEMEKLSRRRAVTDKHGMYESFWETADTMLNSVLFVIIGIYIINMPAVNGFYILVPAAVILNLAARFGSVYLSTFAMGKKSLPCRYSRVKFSSILTVTALRGGLSLALALKAAEYLPQQMYNPVLVTVFTTIFFTMAVQGTYAGKLHKQ